MQNTARTMEQDSGLREAADAITDHQDSAPLFDFVLHVEFLCQQTPLPNVAQ